MRALFVATVRSHIGQFHMPFICALKQEGWQVDAACRDNSQEKPGLDTSALDHLFDLPFVRSPFHPRNLRAFRALCTVLRQNQYDVVHCHTPVGGVLARLAVKMTGSRAKVLYTAHGFHFYKGAPLKYWLLFYPIEKILSRHTDVLITINQEDYDLAKKHFNMKKLYLVHGVGVDLSSFTPKLKQNKVALRAAHHFKDSDFLLIYPADLCRRKNQEMLFETMALLLRENSCFHLLCPGKPDLLETYQARVRELGIAQNVHFLGYTRDIPNLLAMSDLSVSSSRQEGLPVNLIEAMAEGNPVVATDVRGNSDLIENGQNGFLVPLGDSRKMAECILQLYREPATVSEMAQNGISLVQRYTVSCVNAELMQIYKSLLAGEK